MKFTHQLLPQRIKQLWQRNNWRDKKGMKGAIKAPFPWIVQKVWDGAFYPPVYSNPAPTSSPVRPFLFIAFLLCQYDFCQSSLELKQRGALKGKLTWINKVLLWNTKEILIRVATLLSSTQRDLNAAWGWMPSKPPRACWEVFTRFSANIVSPSLWSSKRSSVWQSGRIIGPCTSTRVKTHTVSHT